MENLKYTEILQKNKAMVGQLTTVPYKISMLSNVTINTLKEILEYNCRINKFEPAIEIGNFDNIVQDSANVAGQDMVIVFYDMLSVIDGLGKLFEDISEDAYQSLFNKICDEIDLVLHNLKDIPTVVFNSFSAAYFTQNYIGTNRADRFVSELNAYLIQHKTANTTILELNKIFMQIGINQSIDYRFYHSSKAPYTLAFNKAYVLALQPLLLRNNGRSKKAIIFDCDNTLWKGVVGEDGVEGIDMDPSSHYGKFFYAIQQIATYLSKKGVIIGLCSKNNELDVEEVLLNDRMLLKNDVIIIKKVNWEDKASNLRAIANELNIGIDSLVFVDDSSFEINLIKEQLPEVLTIQVPTNIAEYPTLLLKEIYKNFDFGSNKEDASKTVMYKEQFKREEAKASYSSIEDYLSSLEIEITVSEDNTNHIPRLAQLTQKTNQFNLTTKRYTENQIQGFIESESASILSIFVKDKYGDSGLTGMAIVTEDEHDKESITIDAFLMSCRVIGRNIEYVFLDHLISTVKEKNYKKISACYIPTNKNAQVSMFFEACGFELVNNSDDGTKYYELDVTKVKFNSYPYINLIKN